MSRFGMREISMVMAVAVMVGLAPAASTAEARTGIPKWEFTQPEAVPVEKAKAGHAKNPESQPAPWRAPKVTWPAEGSARVDLATPVAQKGPASPKRAGKLPITVVPDTSMAVKNTAQSPTQVEATVTNREAAHRAGVDGLLLTARRTDGATQAARIKVSVDYSSFRGAYGGDWAARLHLVQMPACALTTPDQPACRVAKPLRTVNDTKSGTLAASIVLPERKASTASAPAVLAVTAAAEGPSGTYKATSLQPSGSWSAGGPTGAFSWSYPVGVPAVPGGLQPKISMDYSSKAVDGRTAATNNQSSWIGDGWSYEPGYIERRYKSCEDDKEGGTNTTRVGDLCWYNDNATLSVGGKTTELIYDKAKGWHPASDSGEKVEKLAGAVNGDKGTDGVDGQGEHWKVTTADGTQYFFGLNRLPGWSDNGTAADDPLTNSTWTAPVFGNQAGEPCYNTSFASAYCQQAWRWQLDYVVDSHGNAMAHYWKTEANNYGRNVNQATGKATATPYTRGGWLDHIDYGLRSDAASVAKAKAMGQVTFGVDERCPTGCSAFDETNAKNWPDVPFDQYCKDGAECKDQYSPSFWTRKRLTSITTKILTGGAYKDVDSWELKQDFRAAGDGISNPLWLESITRTGKSNGTAALPAVTFDSVQRDNRVDKLGDGLAPFVRLRLNQISTESGGTIQVTYSQPDCTASNLPQPDGTNSTRCYPVKWAYEGEDAKLDWFNSYAATEVREMDNLVDTEDTVTTYAYVGDAAWAKSTDEFTKPDDRSYSEARGYYRVQSRKGGVNDAKTLSETRYFRGLDGKTVADSTGSTVIDRQQFAGTPRETLTYNGTDTALVSATSYTPYRSSPTATRTRTDAKLPDLNAYYTGTGEESTRTTTSAGVRTTQLTRHYDAYGMVDSVSETGDTTRTGDEKCTITNYARNTTGERWLLDKVSRTETLAADCDSTNITRPDDVIDDVRNYYDGATSHTTAPTRGNVSKTEQINGTGTGYDPVGSVPSNCGTAKNELCFDIYGRALAGADAYGKVTTTAYTPPTGEPPTKEVSTNPLGHRGTTVLDPLRGQPTQLTDANNNITSTTYDALGRTDKVWAPNRSAVTYPNAPTQDFDYLVRKNDINIVTTKTLTHDAKYATTYTFLDGLLRPRQTQQQSPDLTGRLLTEIFYDGRGLQTFDSGTYYASGNAEPVLYTAQSRSEYPDATQTQYDRTGRITDVISQHKGDETKRTTTTYTGDTTTVTPPTGGIATTTETDALGRTSTLTQYSRTDLKGPQPTTYKYDKLGRLQKVTDPSKATWTYTYDTRGRQILVDDPDKGTTRTVYDKGDRPTDVTDARTPATTLHTDYDEIGRPVALKSGATTLATWEYDNATRGKGLPSTATRHIGNQAYQSGITAYNTSGQPVDTQVIIPSGEGKLAGTYTWSTDYNDTGQVLEVLQPPVGDLPEEYLGYTYSPVWGLPRTVGAGDDSLVSASTFDHYGRLATRQYGAFGKRITEAVTYDEHTGAVTDTYLDRETAPQRIEDNHYTYDLAGNYKAIATGYGQDTTRTTDTQCFLIDPLRRITDAWTNTGDTCAPTPSTEEVGGPDAYWTTYTYDAVGNRKTETQHTTPSGPATDTLRTYTAPTPGTHDLPKVTQTGTDLHEQSFTYDASGNTETRTTKRGTTTADQKLLWDDEGHLKSLTEGTKTSSYLYDTAGQRLISRNSTGTTLYLPGGNELHLSPAGTLTGTRYYTGDKTIAMRTGGKLTFLASDHHGTGTTQIAADTTQSLTRRKTTIFGAPRGDQPTGWAGDKGFVGGTQDADTQLTHLGAREYDPVIGRFISVDPIMDLADPQQIHGYTYANNNPATFSDPTGLMLDAEGGGTAKCTKPEGCVRDVGDDERPATGYKEEGAGQYDYNGDGYISIYPTVHVPAKWSKAPIYIKVFYQNRDRQCEDSDYCGEPENANGLDVNNAKGKACSAAGRDCPQGLGYGTGVGVAGAFVLAAGEEAGRGGGGKWRFGKNGNCAKCFLAGTDVLMADGATKDIEDINVGDEVLATDPETGETGSREVTHLIITEDDKHFNELSIATDLGIEKLTATHEHPFWSPSAARWVDARELTPGATLLTDAGDTVIVTANRSFDRHAKTYNLTVSDLHTYYVLAGETPVLVHNSNCFAKISRQKQDQHVAGTKEYEERLTNGTPTSVFASRSEADAYAQYAWKHGSPVPGRPNVRQYNFGKPTGRGPIPRDGSDPGWQTSVRVHIDGKGRVHGHPVGPVYRD
ncbi:polymorphic toxin-type HINT domain-containing protein [Streptomyces clavifer]|uniref:polymorphic toxin-type HINT domain-containing protein n=1 Tax=Streptomyces clavifer TaxID=68188 RepID=UPI00382AF0C7